LQVAPAVQNDLLFFHPAGETYTLLVELKILGPDHVFGPEAAFFAFVGLIEVD